MPGLLRVIRDHLLLCGCRSEAALHAVDGQLEVPSRGRSVGQVREPAAGSCRPVGGVQLPATPAHRHAAQSSRRRSASPCRSDRRRTGRATHRQSASKSSASSPRRWASPWSRVRWQTGAVSTRRTSPQWMKRSSVGTTQTGARSADNRAPERPITSTPHETTSVGLLQDVRENHAGLRVRR